MYLGDGNLCSFCWSLLDDPVNNVTSRSVQPFHPKFGDVLNSGNTCTLCQWIVSSFHDFDDLTKHLGKSDEPALEEYTIQMVVEGLRKMPSGATWIHVKPCVKNDGPMWETSLTFIGSSPTYLSDQLPDLSSSEVVSGRSISATNSWLTRCIAEHSHTGCGSIDYTARRLISVGLDGKPIRLVDSKNTTEQLRYATLSYCWGASGPLQTTKATLGQFQDEIPSELLPKTFSDAINVTRALGIPYLWIDALCIVQDDGDEWQNEAAHMSEVYQGSQVTIAAAGWDTSCSLFPLGDNDLETKIFYTKKNPEDAHSRLIHIHDGDIRGCALHAENLGARGWVLQEQLLSPRIVTFLPFGVHWQCRTCYQTDSGLLFGLEDIFNAHFRIPSINASLHRDYAWCHETWQRIVNSYSWRRFTYWKDRVPALAGVTKYFASALQDEAILGSWAKSFGKDLAWRSLGEPTHPATLELPSWSWLGYPGGITHGFLDEDEELGSPSKRRPVEHSRLLDWDIQWHGTPQTSPVKEAQIRIEGPVRELELVLEPGENMWKTPYLSVSGEGLDGHRCLGQFDTGNPSVVSSYLCLLLYSAPSKLQADMIQETFIILEPVQMQDGMKHKRIGMARIEGDSRCFDLDRRMIIDLI